MIDKSIETIVEEDLHALVMNGISEGRTIDFKERLEIGRDEEKREFLADVSSFANASGGDLIFGMSEDKGLAKEVIGLIVSDADALRLKAEQLIRDGIQPRLMGVQYCWVELGNSKKAFVIRIPRSWIPPHRVTFRGHDKFYSRSSAGKYPLDVTELRDVFSRSVSLGEQIRRFRAERLSAVVAGETPLPFLSTAKIVIHVVPLASFSNECTIDLKGIYLANPRPMNCSSWDRRYNFDGLLTFGHGPGGCRSYIQYYRNAVVEAVEGGILEPGRAASSELKMTIPSSLFESELERFVSRQLGILKGAGVPTPISVFIALVGVRGYQIACNRDFGIRARADDITAVDRDILRLPEMVITDYGVDLDQGLAPAFDAVWNACGFEESLNRMRKDKV